MPIKYLLDLGTYRNAFGYLFKRIFLLFNQSTQYLTHPGFTPSGVNFEIRASYSPSSAAIGVDVPIFGDFMRKDASNNLVVEYTDTGAATQTITLSALTLVADQDYEIIVSSDGNGVVITVDSDYGPELFSISESEVGFISMGSTSLVLDFNVDTRTTGWMPVSLGLGLIQISRTNSTRFRAQYSDDNLTSAKYWKEIWPDSDASQGPVVEALPAGATHVRFYYKATSDVSPTVSVRETSATTPSLASNSAVIDPATLTIDNAMGDGVEFGGGKIWNIEYDDIDTPSNSREYKMDQASATQPNSLDPGTNDATIVNYDPSMVQ